MTTEPFDARGLRTDRLEDAKGRHVGRVLASRPTEDGAGPGVLEVELAEDVRRERLVKKDTVEVGVWAVELANGHPRLTITLDELLDDSGVSHSNTGDNPKAAPDRSPHMGAETPNRRQRGGG